MKNKIMTCLCVILIIIIVVMIIWWIRTDRNATNEYSDGIETIDVNQIYLEESGVMITFSDVLLSDQEESRKLIVSTQEAEVSFEIEDSLLRQLDYDIFKKTQEVTYTGTGSFVVDLDNLTEDRVIQDNDNKTLTIVIEPAYLQTIEIDPDQIGIGDTQNGFFTIGDITLTVQDYNRIESRILTDMRAQFNTTANKEEANQIAIEMVKAVYQPIVSAIDDRFTVFVEIQNE